VKLKHEELSFEQLKRSSKISETYEDRKRQLLSDMEKKARERGFQIKRTPLGFAPVPLKSDGQPLSEKEFQKLGLEERKRIEENMKSVQKQIKQTFEQFSLLDRKSKEELTKFNRAELLFCGGRQCLLDRALCYTFELVRATH